MVALVPPPQLPKLPSNPIVQTLRISLIPNKAGMAAYPNEPNGGQPKSSPQQILEIYLLFTLYLSRIGIESIDNTSPVHLCQLGIPTRETSFDEELGLIKTVDRGDNDGKAGIGEEPSDNKSSSECTILILDISWKSLRDKADLRPYPVSRGLYPLSKVSRPV